MANAPRNDRAPFGPVGIIGLGLMGQGIAACLVAYGFTVIAFDRSRVRRRSAVAHVEESVGELARRGIIARQRMRNWRSRLQIAAVVAELADCELVIETVTEDLALKRRVYNELERTLGTNAVIASNTSSFPITLLQKGRRHPERFIGMHWGEPAQIMRYLEIIPGRKTSQSTIDRTKRLGEICGKEPTLLREDIRGFLSNRMMYAMIREAFYLVESGIADVETVDRSFRNDIGWWALLAGPFRWMDLTGIPPYGAVMRGLLPKLCNDRKVPRMMRRIVASGAKGVSNARGFYSYTPATARQWEKAWIEFTYDTLKLAEKYVAPGGKIAARKKAR